MSKALIKYIFLTFLLLLNLNVKSIWTFSNLLPDHFFQSTSHIKPLSKCLSLLLSGSLFLSVSLSRYRSLSIYFSGLCLSQCVCVSQWVSLSDGLFSSPPLSFSVCLTLMSLSFINSIFQPISSVKSNTHYLLVGAESSWQRSTVGTKHWSSLIKGIICWRSNHQCGPGPTSLLQVRQLLKSPWSHGYAEPLQTMPISYSLLIPFTHRPGYETQ